MAIHVGEIGQTLPPIERKDGHLAPTTDPTCQREDCDGLLRDTGRTQSTASAGTISDLQCSLCSRHSWWRHRPAFEMVAQDLIF
jgi:hypothetical protein